MWQVQGRVKATGRYVSGARGAWRNWAQSEGPRLGFKAENDPRPAWG